jgi:molecular chaperone GrpE (heat shock protein)
VTALRLNLSSRDNSSFDHDEHDMTSIYEAPKLKKWPFFLADVLLLGTAIYLIKAMPAAGSPWWMFFLVASVGLAAWAATAPFLAQHRADMKLAEARSLTTAVEQIANLRTLTNQISFATAQWQVVKDEASKTVGSAKQIADQMAAEAKAFSEFIEKASDAEKAHLRLEVDKLRRGETEWVQVLVMMLDHVYALYLAGRRSGQQNIIQQLSAFQNACREVTRRVGLIPFEGQPNEAFNAKMHQLLDSTDSNKLVSGKIGETLAPGYMFQGHLIRAAVVALQASTAPPAEPELEFSGTAS